MDLFVAILMTVLLGLYLFYIRNKPQHDRYSVHPANPTHTAGPEVVKVLESCECIYSDPSTVLRARLVEVNIHEDELQLRLQPLHTEGLSVCPDDTLSASAPWRTMEHSATYLHAQYAHWKIFFDRKLIDEVTALAQRGEGLETIKRALLEYRKKALV